MLAVMETAPDEISTVLGDTVKDDNTGASKSALLLLITVNSALLTLLP